MPLTMTSWAYRCVQPHCAAPEPPLGFDFASTAFAIAASTTSRAPRRCTEALREQSVSLDGRVRKFAAGERIHTENSQASPR
jgi:hypothetical protein